MRTVYFNATGLSPFPTFPHSGSATTFGQHGGRSLTGQGRKVSRVHAVKKRKTNFCDCTSRGPIEPRTRIYPLLIRKDRTRFMVRISIKISFPIYLARPKIQCKPLYPSSITNSVIFYPPSHSLFYCSLLS